MNSWGSLTLATQIEYRREDLLHAAEQEQMAQQSEGRVPEALVPLLATLPTLTFLVAIVWRTVSGSPQ